MKKVRVSMGEDFLKKWFEIVEEDLQILPVRGT